MMILKFYELYYQSIIYMIDDYKTLKKLGRGAFGTVYLVQDQNQNLFAIKEMDLKRIAKQPYLYEYLQGQIQIMKKLNSPYIINLYDTEEKNKTLYLLCEYCNGGDLEKDQAKQKNKVYQLQNAFCILADVIKGLQLIHSSGYLHRDIKSQNILVKIQDGKKKYKVADFGLSKKGQGNTVLGTGHFMSPQIYLEEGYSFEVDMWAFGVMLYFMLNKEYPFKQNAHDNDLKRKYKFLVDQAKNFSYKKFVENSKLKRFQNCTQQVEDLFSKIFAINPESRITFLEIRRHPLFEKYFPEEIQQQSRILYGKKFNGKKHPDQMKKKEEQEIIEETNEEEEDTVILRSTIRPKNMQFPIQKETLQRKNDEIEFLYQNYNQFAQTKGILKLIESTALCYNLVKYYIVLKRNFFRELRSGSFIKKYQNLNMRGFGNTKEFGEFVAEVEQQLDTAEGKFQLLHIQCNDCMEEILQINNKFSDSFNGQISETEFEDPFKSCYRKSTLHTFQKLKKYLKQKRTGNKINYFLVLSVICHVFNHIFVQKQKMRQIFSQFLEAKKMTVDNINFEVLREWLTLATPSQLNNLAKLIISKYFT